MSEGPYNLAERRGLVLHLVPVGAQVVEEGLDEGFQEGVFCKEEFGGAAAGACCMGGKNIGAAAATFLLRFGARAPPHTQLVKARELVAPAVGVEVGGAHFELVEFLLGGGGDLGKFILKLFEEILEIIIKSLSIFFLNFEIFVKRFKIFEILNFFIFQILQKSKILREKIMLLSKS